MFATQFLLSLSSRPAPSLTTKTESMSVPSPWALLPMSRALCESSTRTLALDLLQPLLKVPTQPHVSLQTHLPTSNNSMAPSETLTSRHSLKSESPKAGRCSEPSDTQPTYTGAWVPSTLPPYLMQGLLYDISTSADTSVSLITDTVISRYSFFLVAWFT